MIRQMLSRVVLLISVFTAGVLSTHASGQERDDAFDTWLSALQDEAVGKGIGAETVRSAMAGVAPIKRVIELDRSQPEFTQTFGRYFTARVSQKRIERGRQLLTKHRALLEKVRARYGVQPRFLVSFWGLETNFGDYLGAFPLTGALATLAYDGRRSDFFRAQLLALLQIMDGGDVAYDAKGSWAGAMGQVQFIPTTFREYAVDFDGDRRRDLWANLQDIFGSAANYLSSVGWDGTKTWGREVRLPKGFDLELAGLGVQKSLTEWQALGVRRSDGRDLPKVDITGSVVLPAGHDGPVFMVYKNFRKIMVWNRSIFYALAVGHLADRIAGRSGPISRVSTDEKPMSRDQVMEMQGLLVGQGFGIGEPDGIIGSKTRAAIKSYQKQAGLPPDGHPNLQLLQHLRKSQ